MAEQKDLLQAQKVFATFCAAMDADDWNYKKDEEKLRIECGARGDDLPIELNISVDADRQLLMVLSQMPVVTPEDKRLDVAVAVSVVNNQLVNGYFDYDVKSGKMFFRMVNTIRDSVIGKELCAYMLYVSCKTVDEYNDKFLMLAKGILSLEQFLAAENK